MNVNDSVRYIRENLAPVHGRREANAMIRLIFYALKGWDATDILVRSDEELSPYMMDKINGILERLKKHEPLQYILGEAYFYGLRFRIVPGVLIPRQDSETIIDMIAKDNGKSDLRVLDIATGSGCIAIALARTLEFPQVSAVDISPRAISLARENAEALKVKVDFIRADIFSWQPDPLSLDIIVSNPPYVDESEKADMETNVRDYEPAEALFVPDDNPLVFYRRISAIAREALAPGGKLYLEINPRHADDIARLLSADGFSDVEISLDIHGSKRFASCVRPSDS